MEISHCGLVTLTDYKVPKRLSFDLYLLLESASGEASKTMAAIVLVVVGIVSRCSLSLSFEV
jgi:hypothetical protein